MITLSLPLFLSHTHTHTLAYTHIHAHRNARSHMLANMQTHMCMCPYAQTHTHTHTLRTHPTGTFTIATQLGSSYKHHCNATHHELDHLKVISETQYYLFIDTSIQLSPSLRLQAIRGSCMAQKCIVTTSKVCVCVCCPGPRRSCSSVHHFDV